MRYIKLFETPFIHDLFSQAKFKVGDIVRTKDNLGLFDEELMPGHNYFNITDINSVYDDGYNFLLHNIITPDVMDFYEKQDNIELVPDYEIAAMKYNL